MGGTSSAKKIRNVVGPQIRKIRTQNALSQEKLALRIQLAGLDWNRVSLAKVESQIKKVCDGELFVIAQVLKAPLESLYPTAEKVKKFVAVE